MLSRSHRAAPRSILGLWGETDQLRNTQMWHSQQKDGSQSDSRPGKLGPMIQDGAVGHIAPPGPTPSPLTKIWP